jgi:hypothetical protein
MKTLVIDRKMWWRGKNNSMLRKPGGKMCCLGFLGRSCGYTTKELTYYYSPASRMNSYANRYEKSKWPNKLLEVRGAVQNDSDLCNAMIEVNDELLISDEKREAELKKLFKKIGYKVIFK